MIKKIAVLVAIAALGGCSATYTYQGKKYDSKEKFQQAVDSKHAELLAAVAPLPTPLTRRKLVFAFPSESVILNESVRRFVAIEARQPNSVQNEIIENLAAANSKDTKFYFYALQKMNIYSSVQLVYAQSMESSFAASEDTDALYFVEPSLGSGQWFYASFKHGKQIFSFDRSSPNPEGKVQAFIEAVQVQAIRD